MITVEGLPSVPVSNNRPTLLSICLMDLGYNRVCKLGSRVSTGVDLVCRLVFGITPGLFFTNL
jgi:hypothetical protein